MAPTTRSSKPKKSPGSKQKKRLKQNRRESVEDEIDYTDGKSDSLGDESLYNDLELDELAQQAAELMTGHHTEELTGSTPGSKRDTDQGEENDLEAVLPFVVDVDSNVNSKIKISTNHATDTISRNFPQITDENVEEDSDDGFMSLKQTTQQKKEDEEEMFISLESEQDDNKKMSLNFIQNDQAKSKQSGKEKSVQRNKEMELPTELDPGLDFNETYFDLQGQSGIDGNNKAAKAVLTASSRDKLLKNSILSPDFEKLHSVPSHKESIRQMQRRRKKERESKTGDGWYNMAAAEMTDKLRNDIKAIRMRSTLDPKRFYKNNDMKALPKFVQVGTVVESAADFYHSRVPKKQRKQTIVEELLADVQTRRYNKRKYMELQEKRMRWHKGDKGKKRKKNKK